MKGRALILIFLFFALISINNVSCESGNGTLTGYIIDEKSHSETFGLNNLWNGDYRAKINLDLAGIPDTFQIKNVQASNKSTWEGTASNVGDPFNIYYSADGTAKTELVGYGVVYVHKKAFVSGTLFDVDLTFYIDDITIDKTGSQWYIFDGGWTVFNSYYNGLYLQMDPTKYNNYYDNLNCVVVPGAEQANIYNLIGAKSSQTATYEYKYKGSFKNEYTYDVASTYFDIDIQRQGFSETYDFKSSKIKVVDYTDDSTYYQSGYSTSNTSHFLNVDNYSYYLVRNIDDYHHLIYTSYEEEDEGDGQSAVIEFNQTHYTDPENVEMEWDIIAFDSDAYTYEIQVITSVSGEFSQDSWPADGNWNVSPFISSASGVAVFDFYSDGYYLPIWIQGELWAQDKSSGTWTKLDNTPAVIYHEKSDFGVGSIWTEKNSYNLSEMFYIFVETDYPIVEVELISDTYHDIQSLEVFEGGWQRVGYAFFSPHNFTAYLYEGGVITNQTSFSVWTTSPMLNIFLDSEALKTQFAFEFYTDNSSDTITGYKPDGSIFYGPITDLETGDRNIIRGVSSSSPPGIYTISLFHDGTTYYNDTIELYSTSEWVYFEASKYETGDRIKIYSYVTDSRQQVRLTDSIGTAVITWTDSAGYIIPNGQTVLYFSLTDNNEYGMNVNSSIDAGTFRTGNWKVEIIGIDGKPLTDESTYDYTTVSKRIDSPEDTSNEMISIFFSPEGAFMLYTVCLTMMGLVLAKHPAGGGAGATVGVGFGVYFNVLPPWMLMLTVILLVVLGGVSVAVYYRGK